MRWLRARGPLLLFGCSAVLLLGGGRVMLFDKTGTLTHGRPTLAAVVTADDAVDADTVLCLAASLDQVSPHVLAGSIVAAATRRGLALKMPEEVLEEHGHGLRGRVGTREVMVGKAAWIVGDTTPAWVRQVVWRANLDGYLTVFVAIDGEPAGAFLLHDPIRSDAPRMVRALREAGISRVVLVTGDRSDIADTVGRIVGVDTVLADCDPGEKLAAIASETSRTATIMVGDGVNDAPALAAASVGVALAARGATASSEAADVVLTVDRLDCLADDPDRAAVEAVVQEAIDVLAIGVALRAVLPGRAHTIRMPSADIVDAHGLKLEHDAVQPVVEQIRSVADSLSTRDSDLGPTFALLQRLDGELLPHQRADEAQLLPLVDRALGSSDTTVALSRTHAEIEHQVSLVRRLLADVDNTTVQPEDVVELRRLLYGLYAVLRLHNSQEEESAFSLVPTDIAHPVGP